jgi:hypothetical protein
MIHTDEDDEFDRILRENRLKGQPYHWESDAIKAAVLAEREACARICDELQDDIATEPKHCAEKIRARGNT